MLRSLSTTLGLTERSLTLQGRTEEAERYFVRALAAAKAGFGECDPHVAAASNNLAELLRLQRRFADAAPLYEQVRLMTASMLLHITFAAKQ